MQLAATILFCKSSARDGVVANFESQIYRKDKSIIWISENAPHSTKNLEGQIEYYEGTVVDISARKQSEDLHREIKAADAANRAKSQFLAHMSHELRTPLNGVIGMLDLLRETALSQQQQHYASIARSSADLLLSLINEILDLSKIEAGKLEIEQVDFELRPVIEAALEMLGSKARQKGLELTLNMPPELAVVVCGDPQRLQQVIVNLLSNAIKFTKHGHVQVRVTLESQSGETLTVLPAQDVRGHGYRLAQHVLVENVHLIERDCVLLRIKIAEVAENIAKQAVADLAIAFRHALHQLFRTDNVFAEIN